ncbi:MAG: carbohydrate ABC transporter substrate-binding protein [Peptococcaceae bacterium]|nr:carbohydrate ABC transporter substrate-binding protein [Peptococcaceae bacterium]
MKKNLCVAIVCVLFLFSVAGCISAPTQGKPGGEAPAVISVWYSLDGKNEEELKKQFDRINKERPEIFIKGEKVSESNFVEKVWNLQAGGEGPEIFIANRATIFALYEKGAISPALADKYHTFPSAQAVFTFNQQPFAAPWLADIPLLYYRADRVQEPPLSMNGIIEKKNTIALKTFSLDLLGAWWKAEGGVLSSNGLPLVNAQTNLAFLNKVLFYKGEGTLLFDNQALERFVRGDVNYYLGWASDRIALEKAAIPWGCVSPTSLLGAGGQVLLDHTIGIANSSVKTVPAMERAIRLAEEELLKVQTEAPMQKSAGYIPLEDAYYSDVQPGSYHHQVKVTLENALYLEGYHPDWKFMIFENRAWANVAAGSNMETELAKEQLSALETTKKP